MKKLLLNVAFLVASFTSIAQVGIGTTTPDASAVLEIESTTKGFLLPRMTLAQINAIATPAEGLMVYCLDGPTIGLLVNSGLEFVSLINGESLDKVAVAAIVAAAGNSADGTPSLDDLTELGITNLTAGQTAYQEAIADASPAPTTLAELQAIIDAVNTELAAVVAIVAAADNPAADGTPSLDDLNTVGIKNLTAGQIAYEELIADASPAPTTLAELQAIIDAVNTELAAVVAIVAAADNPAADGTPNLDDLNTVGIKNLTAGQIAYEEAIADASPAPTTLAELQAIIDTVNNNIGKDTTTTVVDITGPSGRVWMDRNLGATQAALSSTDELSYGDYYQWGRAKDGHESSTSNTRSTMATSATPGHGDFIVTPSWTDFAGEDNLWQSGLNDPCPTGYRIPTEVELQNEFDQFSSTYVDDAFLELKLPLAGNRSYSNGNFSNVGSWGYYWSSTVSSTKANGMNFTENSAFIKNIPRAFGFSVRCIKD
jgi:hypothetical protein